MVESAVGISTYIFLESNFPPKQPVQAAETAATAPVTMDEYSFCVGAWCAMSVEHPNDSRWHENYADNPPNQFHYDPIAVMNFAATNGWPPINR